MKTVIKKILVEIVKYTTISAVLYGCVFLAHQLCGFNLGQAQLYSVNNSAVSSDSFSSFRMETYKEDHAIFVSDNTAKNNELWMFETTDNSLFSLLHLSGRYKKTPYLHVSSENPVASIQFDFTIGETDETVLIYYSHNKDNISLCRYTKKSDDGHIETIEQTINPYCAFAINIPCTKNNRSWKYEIQNVSFYDSYGNIIFTDKRIF